MAKDYSKLLYLSQAGGALGTPVYRAAAVDPQNVWLPIFTIAGGLVRIMSIIGVRTLIQAGGASNMQFRHSVGPTAWCAATAITGNAIGTIYTVTGIFADALTIGAAGVSIQAGLSGSIGGGANSLRGLLVGAGTIDVTMTAAAGTGSTRYIVRYIPEDAGATIVAA